ncbi:hypothetical protein PILCRDRAFT_816975 [Piloderma croceum F 1598]|uniref:Uncharacterized protein n=1 Tax=Piloderma croceum (strain F 1598) TaxID=765440 RepID=A0A0C3FP99_PILCF|nr:hypothetical protein PILCRDRAFT_816975 [Piloderma croceum F 1598]
MNGWGTNLQWLDQDRYIVVPVSSVKHPLQRAKNEIATSAASLASCATSKFGACRVRMLCRNRQFQLYLAPIFCTGWGRISVIYETAPLTAFSTVNEARLWSDGYGKYIWTPK